MARSVEPWGYGRWTDDPTETETAKWADLLDQVQRAHRKLDSEGVPRNDDHGGPLTLALRIAVLIETYKER